MPLPAQKYLRVIRGTTFDYPFQYLSGSVNPGPVPLWNYKATWTITWTKSVSEFASTAQLGDQYAQMTHIQLGSMGSELSNGSVTYTNPMPYMAGQLGTRGSHPLNEQLAVVGRNPTLSRSGVYFGGTISNPANGQIDLIIAAQDTLGITWSQATYLLTLTDANGVTIPILTGALGVV